MVKLRCWKMSGGEFTVKARDCENAFDIADDRGAVRVVDDIGEIFLKLVNEWTGVGFEFEEERR